MNALKTLMVAGLCLLSHTLLAANPAKGWYAGLIFGGSYPLDLNFNIIDPITGQQVDSKLSYSYGGVLGGQIGFRCDQFHVEFEGLYNTNPYSKLTLGDLEIKRHATLIGGFPIHFKGNTQTYAGLLNAYYDFYQVDNDFAPYLGLGIGYAYTVNQFSLYNNEIHFFSADKSHSSAIGQAIVGAQYFIDDTVSVGLDYRLVALSKLEFQGNINSNSFLINTLNLTFNFAFEPDLGIS